jgi:hypothetical protein
VEGEGGFKVRSEVGPVVTAGIKMELVRNFAGGEEFVESRGAGFEAEIVFGTAVEIDFHTREQSSAGERERAVALPERRIGREAENAAEEAGTSRSWHAPISGEEGGKFFDEGSAVGADRRKQLRMSEGEMESPVTAHGNAGDGAIGAAGADAIAAFDERKKFLQEKILVAGFAVARVDVKAGFARWSGNEEILEAAFFAEVFDEVPRAGAEKGLLVVAEAVEEIEDGKAARFVGVKAGGEKNAIWNGACENFAGDGVALGTAGNGGGAGDVKEVEEKEEVDPSLRSG